MTKPRMRVPGCKVALRDARPRDCSAVASLLRELGYPTQARTVERRLIRLRKSEGSRVLVAVVGGRVVGVAGLHVMPLLHRDHGLCRILALSVTTTYRRLGVGRRLMDAVENIARRAGCHRLELTTAVERTDAHAFYRKLGYVEASKRFAKTVKPPRRGGTKR